MKSLLITCCLFAIYSCGSKEEKKETPEVTTSILQEETENEQSEDDKALQTWLQGKVWTAEESMAPMRLMKLKTDGECEFFNGSADPWTIVKSELVLKKLTEWPVKKVDDSTFSLYVKPSDVWYLYKLTENL